MSILRNVEPLVKIGQRSGLLTVIGGEFWATINRSASRSRHVMCRCDCGKANVVSSYYIKSRQTRSCGCATGGPPKIHGLCSHPLYGTWHNMVARCHYIKAANYKYYGGRGITVCDEWRSGPDAFIKWAMVHDWRADFQLDRINNEKGYSPNNCRFVDRKMNNRNTRSNRWETLWGERKTVAEWIEDDRCEVSASTLRNRLKEGMPFAKAMTMPLSIKLPPPERKSDLCTVGAER